MRSRALPLTICKSYVAPFMFIAYCLMCSVCMLLFVLLLALLLLLALRGACIDICIYIYIYVLLIYVRHPPAKACGQHEGLNVQRVENEARSKQPLLTTPIPWDPLRFL